MPPWAPHNCRHASGVISCLLHTHSPAERLQPMDLRHYPFDSLELLVTLEFLDTSLKASGHPGVSVELSSGGAQLYSCAHAAAAAAGAARHGVLPANDAAPLHPNMLTADQPLKHTTYTAVLGITSSPAELLQVWAGRRRQPVAC